MFVLYFVYVNGYFSSESKEWANFGAYFGSITGLLAFAGVLYTASLSENRAEEEKRIALKAEEESIKREERDQFIKLLNIFQNKLELIEIDTYKGNSAFRLIAEEAINCSKTYTALIYSQSNNYVTDKISENEAEIMLSFLENARIRNYDLFAICWKENLLSTIKYDDLLSNSTQASSYFDFITNFYSISKEKQYQCIKYVGTEILTKYGFILEPYLKNLYLLISFIFESNNITFFNDVITAQISRYEALIIMYCSLSTSSDYKVVRELSNTSIFKNIKQSDYIFFKGDHTSIPSFEITLDNLFTTCLNDIRQYYIEEFETTIPHD